MYVFTVTPPFTFDKKCTLPACFSSDRMSTDDIDLDSCRVVASGIYDDSTFPNVLRETSVQEVAVKITSANETYLTLSRVDDIPTITCTRPNDNNGRQAANSL
ncbi:uncharacterized protein LOC143285611 [Babylonia areolata]|uniref:uncharacterized protein LOC143285611 n=1 Tax=Babylonia areolata TaxID=304850 RepID=UPI003FD3B2E7